MKKRIAKIYEFSVVIEKDEKRYFFAYVPSLQGCYAQGKSLSEALANIKEVIELHIGDRIAENEPIPKRRPVSLSSIEVKI